MDKIDFESLDIEKLGILIKERLNEKSLSIKTFSENLNISPSLIALAISGRRRLSPLRYREIFSILEISEDELPYINIEKKEGQKAKTDNKIFVSYSHKDNQYLERLLVHLKPLEKQGLIDTWVDTRLLAGDKWKKEIENALQKAKIGILLISADFLASDFIINNELPPLLQNAEKSGTLIIPVILKPCRFLRDKNLREFQTINSPDEPLSLIGQDERELVYDTIAQRIEEVINYK